MLYVIKILKQKQSKEHSGFMYTFQKNDVSEWDASQIGKMLDPPKECPAH